MNAWIHTHTHTHTDTHTHTLTHTHKTHTETCWRVTLKVFNLPFGVQKIVDFLVIDLHVGDLHLAGEFSVGPRSDVIKQLVTKTWDDALLAPRTHHGVRFA